MSGEGSYTCALKPDTLEKAKRELNEDPKQRASHIQALRDWVTSQPHIRSRTGACTPQSAGVPMCGVMCMCFINTFQWKLRFRRGTM